MSPPAPGGVLWRLRAAAEWSAALALLIFFLPFLAVVACAILLESGRPVLFRQPRFGLNGGRFDALKFRTMLQSGCDPSGAGQTANQDPRITRVGNVLRRTSFDELPQLWNVLRGEMSLIGPRAHPCGMEVGGRLCEDVDPRYHARHVVRPGITGWAQVNGSRGAVKSPEALQRRTNLDLDYVANWTPALDLKIIAKTLGVLIHADAGR